jgi:hypothetical protein
MIERDHYQSQEAAKEAPAAGTVPQQEGTMLTRSKHWLADRVPVRSKHWFVTATLWLIGAAVLLSTDSWRWS